MNNWVGITLLAFFSFLWFSCATAPEGVRGKTSRVIDMGNYSFEMPPGGGWKIEIGKEQAIIKFTRPKYSLQGGLVGSTLIFVFQNRIRQQEWYMNEQEVADDFRNQEENWMVEEFVKKGHYNLKDVKKDVITIGDKKLYFMSYKATVPLLKGGGVTESILYLYFPTDFKENNIFYGFLFSESHATGALVTFDVELIHYVIKNFQLK